MNHTKSIGFWKVLIRRPHSHPAKPYISQTPDPPPKRPLSYGRFVRYLTRGGNFFVDPQNQGGPHRSRPPDHPRSSRFNLTYCGVELFCVWNIHEPSKKGNFGKWHFFFKNAQKIKARPIDLGPQTIPEALVSI